MWNMSPNQVANGQWYLLGEENGIPHQRGDLVLDALDKMNVKIEHAGSVNTKINAYALKTPQLKWNSPF